MTTVPTTSTQKSRIRTSLRSWKGKIENPDQELFQAFVEQTLNRLRVFLAQHRPNDVLRYLEVAFRFAKNRASVEPKVDIQSGPNKGIVTLVNMPDQPFIVDTIRLYLKEQHADYWSGFNLVFPASRNEKGELIAVGNEDGNMESLVLLESDLGQLLNDQQKSVDALATNLQMAKAMVRDFRSMTRCVERVRERLEEAADQKPSQSAGLRETAAFFKVALARNFVFM